MLAAQTKAKKNKLRTIGFEPPSTESKPLIRTTKYASKTKAAEIQRLFQ